MKENRLFVFYRFNSTPAIHSEGSNTFKGIRYLFIFGCNTGEIDSSLELLTIPYLYWEPPFLPAFIIIALIISFPLFDLETVTVRFWQTGQSPPLHCLLLQNMYQRQGTKGWKRSFSSFKMCFWIKVIVISHYTDSNCHSGIGVIWIGDKPHRRSWIFSLLSQNCFKHLSALYLVSFATAPGAQGLDLAATADHMEHKSICS